MEESCSKETHVEERAPKEERMCKQFKKYGLTESYMEKVKNPSHCCGKCGRCSNDMKYLCHPQKITSTPTEK